MRINHRSYLYVFMNQYRHFLSNLTRLSPPCRWLMRIIYRLWLWNFQNSLRFLSIFQINCYRCSDVCFNIFCRATVTWFFEALEKRNDNNNHKNESQNYPPPSSPRYCVSIKWQMMSLKRGQSERSYLNHVTRNSEWKRAVIRRGQKTSSNDNIYQIPLFLCWWWRLFFFFCNSCCCCCCCCCWQANIFNPSVNPASAYRMLDRHSFLVVAVPHFSGRITFNNT